MRTHEGLTPPAELLPQLSAAYEKGRWFWALGRVLPVSLIPASVLLLGGRPAGVLGFGFLLMVSLVPLLWSGKELARGAWVGLSSGLPALAFPLAAQFAGHACLSSGCYSLCIPACISGGLVAGFLLSRRCLSSPSPVASMGSALGVALLTGALGCSCVGFSGVAGLFAGLVFASSAAAVAWRKV